MRILLTHTQDNKLNTIIIPTDSIRSVLHKYCRLKDQVLAKVLDWLTRPNGRIGDVLVCEFYTLSLVENVEVLKEVHTTTIELTVMA